MASSSTPNTASTLTKRRTMASRAEYGYDPLPTRKPPSRSSTGSSSFSDAASSSSERLEEGRGDSVEGSLAEQQQSNASVAILVVSYFTLNLLLTFYNKSLLNNFPYPYFLTSLHAASGVIGCLCLRIAGVPFTPAQCRVGAAGRTAVGEKQSMDRRGSSSTEASKTDEVDPSSPSSKAKKLAVVLMYSALYAANIAMSNASLRLVSMPFHQIVRSTCPLFTLTLAYFVLSKRPAKRSLMALAPVVAGAALSCVGGSVRFTSLGVFLTILGTFLAALKTVTTNILQGGGNAKTGEKQTESNGEAAQTPLAVRIRQSVQRYAFQYTALELLEVMSPLAFVQCLAASYLSGELGDAVAQLTHRGAAFDRSMCSLLAGNGAIAFVLNVVSFKTNKAAGPLTMTVVGNVKQVVTIVMAVHVYSLTIAPINAFGIVVALVGTAWYGAEGMRSKRS